MNLATITGKVIDVGDLPEGRGFSLEVDGETVALVGLTIAETKGVAALLGERLTVTICHADTSTGKP